MDKGLLYNSLYYMYNDIIIGYYLGINMRPKARRKSMLLLIKYHGYRTARVNPKRDSNGEYIERSIKYEHGKPNYDQKSVAETHKYWSLLQKSGIRPDNHIVLEVEEDGQKFAVMLSDWNVYIYPDGEVVKQDWP